MTIQEFKDLMTVEYIRIIVESLGGVICSENDDEWISNTICHGGNSNKLYFYKDSLNFYCYSECGSMDVITLIQEVKGFDTPYKAITWACIKLNIDNCEYGFGKQEIIEDWDFINKLSRRRNKKISTKELVEIPLSTLGMFQKFYYSGWIDEGISIESMRKYNIMYSTWQQRIVIPHFDINGRLIGIRGRAMIEEDEIRYGKYTPLMTGSSDKKFYNHELGLNLYGLDKNIDTIKRKRKVLLLESEKGVMQCDTLFKGENFTVALCGSNLTKEQIKLILSLGVLEVIVGLDKQYEKFGNEDCHKWEKKIRKKFINPLAPYVKVSVLWDEGNLLGYKDSPTDKGLDVLLELMDNKIYGNTLTH